MSAVEGSVAAPEAPASTPVRRKRKFYVDFPFTKEPASVTKGRGAQDPGEEPGLWLTGYANTWVQDRDGDYVDPKAFDNSLADYLRKNPIVLHQHKMDRSFGQVHDADVDDTGLWVRAFVPEPVAGEEPWKVSAFHDTRRGVLRTFSIGGYFHYDIENLGEDDEKWIIREVELFEISVVSIPSNPDSIFEAAAKSMKASDDTPTGHFLSDKGFRQMLQLLGVEDVTDPALVTLNDDGRRERYAVLGRLYEEDRGRKAPDFDALRSVLDGVPDDADLLVKADALRRVAPVVGELWQPPEGVGGKSGRVLSKQNEDLLDAALAALEGATENVRTVVSQVKEAEEVDESETEEEQ